MSAFWRYFSEILHWPHIHAPGSLQALTRGLAGHLDLSRDDMLYLREQFFPDRCASEILPEHGDSRGVIRHASETDAQFRVRVTHAWRWHMLGGKALGLPEILKIYGWDEVRIENMRTDNPSRWAEFSVGLKSPQNNNYDDILATLGTFVWLINEYKPARSVLWRIYTDEYDRRPIVLSVGPVLGDGWLSYYSGVPVEGLPDGDDVIVSFGVKNSFQSERYLTRDLAASFGATTWLGFLAPYLDTFRVGRSKLSWVPPRNNPFVIGSLFSILWADRQTRPRQWRGEWDARCWLDYTAFDRKLPPWRMPGRSLSRSQLVPGWGEALADNNARLGVSFATVIDAPPRLGWFRLSAHDNQRRTLRIHEFFIVTNGLASSEVQPGTPQTASQSAGAYSAALPDPCRVQQAGHSALAARSHSIGHDVQASRQDSHALACSESQRAGQLCVQSASALHGTPLHLHGAWHGAWDKRRWWPYCADTKISATDCIQSAFMVFNSPGGAFGAPAFASSETLLTPFYFVSEL